MTAILKLVFLPAPWPGTRALLSSAGATPVRKAGAASECKPAARIGISRRSTNADLDEARAQGGLGLFVRSIVGLERDAAKAAFADFLASRNLNANHIKFVNLIVEHLTERGAMDPRRLYESPFTDFDDQGVSGVFPQSDVHQIVQLVNEVGRRAAA